jgi:hypothetical protein
MDYKWLQKICDSTTYYNHVTAEIKTLTMPNGDKFTLATNGHILAAYQVASNEPDFPHPARESAIKMLTRQEGQAVSFADLCKWVEVERYHDCPFCSGTGKRESNRIDEEDGTLLEVYQWPLGGILCGQSIDRRLLHLPFNHLQAETITIAALSDLKRDEYHPVQIHCAEWILCIMPYTADEEEKAKLPVFSAQLSCAP